MKLHSDVSVADVCNYIDGEGTPLCLGVANVSGCIDEIGTPWF